MWGGGWPLEAKLCRPHQDNQQGTLLYGGGGGLGGLDGSVGLAPEPSGQVQGPALKARLPEAYPTCPLPKQSSAVSQPGHSQREW